MANLGDSGISLSRGEVNQALSGLHPFNVTELELMPVVDNHDQLHPFYLLNDVRLCTTYLFDHYILHIV